MRELVKDIVDFEARLIETILLQDSEGRVPLYPREKSTLRKSILELLRESYLLLTPEEKKHRLSFIEGLRLKGKTLLESHGIESTNQSYNDFVCAEELKSIIIKRLREDNNSYKLMKSPYHYKSLILLNYLIPPEVRNRLLETKDISDETKLNAIIETITKLVVMYNSPVQV